MRLLFAEDDRMIGEVVRDALRDEGYAVDWVLDGAKAEAALAADEYALVVLDLGLPEKDGLHVLRDLRKANRHVPVLIATARDRVQHRVEGLDAGADDYVVKPYDLDELLARIRVLLRRVHGRSETVYEHGNIRINPVSKEVSVDGRQVALSSREWSVLEALISRPGLILSRAQLQDKLWGWKEEIASNAVEVYIHGLRKKLGPDVIQTVRGMGYLVPASVRP